MLDWLQMRRVVPDLEIEPIVENLQHSPLFGSVVLGPVNRSLRGGQITTTSIGVLGRDELDDVVGEGRAHERGDEVAAVCIAEPRRVASLANWEMRTGTIATRVVSVSVNRR